MNIVVTLLAGVVGILSASAAELTVREIQPGVYEFELTNPTVLSESEAMAQIAKAAASTCKGVTAIPGR